MCVPSKNTTVQDTPPVLIAEYRLPVQLNDSGTFIIASYRVWRLAVFAITGLAVLAPLIKKLWHLRKVRLPFDEHAYRLLFLCTGMLCLCFFYVNSQMHERYAHPIIIC